MGKSEPATDVCERSLCEFQVLLDQDYPHLALESYLITSSATTGWKTQTMATRVQSVVVGAVELRELQVEFQYLAHSPLDLP